MIITFCGHASFQGNENIKNKLIDVLKNVIGNNHADFYLGGYGGFDNFAYRCCLEYKEKIDKNCKLYFISPYLDNKYLKTKTEFMKGFDDILFADTESVLPRYAILKRNQWMVNQSSFLIAYVVFMGSHSGKTLDYAIKHKIPYMNLAEF